jgi:glutathione synthase/RimK-type ligase-like ATP-grasp enzyme
MKFYALYEKLYEGVQTRLDQLKAACDKLGVDFVSLDASKIDYTKLPILSKVDLLYNVAAGSTTLESLLLNNEVISFYINNPPFTSHLDGTIPLTLIHEKAKLPAPKTIFNITTDRDLLKKYVDYLGDFPIIIKAAGSTRGVGTIKIETWQNLISTADYLATTGDRFIMREFIKAKSGCRMIVLGNEVIAAADFKMNKGDFRNAVLSNEVDYFKRDYPEWVKEVAVKATRMANLEFSGVDFLEDEQGNYYLLEINFPTGFSGLIDVCYVDIPLKMVNFLKNKTAFNQ